MIPVMEHFVFNIVSKVVKDPLLLLSLVLWLLIASNLRLLENNYVSNKDNDIVIAQGCECTLKEKIIDSFGGYAFRKRV